MEDYISRAHVAQILKVDTRLGGLDQVAPEGKDGRKLNYMSKEDYDKNIAVYGVFINSLAYILKDKMVHSDLAIRAIIRMMDNRGLINFIKESDEYFTAFIVTKAIPYHPVFQPMLQEILSTEYEDALAIQVASEIFRFGKRFAPFGNSTLAAKCIDDFWACEDINKHNDCFDSPHYWTRAIRRDSGVLCEVWYWLRPTEDGNNTVYLSPNAIQGTCSCMFCKWLAALSLLDRDTDLLSRLQKEEIVSLLKDDRPRRFTELYTLCHPDINQDEAEEVGSQYSWGAIVPKNWKAYRLIAKDQIDMYHYQMKVENKMRYIIENYTLVTEDGYEIDLEKAMPIDDQAIQRFRAQQGSITGEIATLDLSSASDLHRKKLIRELYPKFVADELLEYVPKGMILGRRAEKLSMFAPMGSPLTFRTMQLTLWRIGYTVIKTYAFYANWDSDRTHQAIERLGVFGDDITCDVEVTDLYIHALEALGFKVNIAKSYKDTVRPIFREACGGDYYDGVDIAPQYWPRRQLDLTAAEHDYHVDSYTNKMDDNISSMISLSKNIRRFSPSAADYLNDVCLRIEPSLTASPVGSRYPDLWSQFPLGKPLVASAYADIMHYRVQRAEEFTLPDGTLLKGSEGKPCLKFSVAVGEEFWSLSKEEREQYEEAAFSNITRKDLIARLNPDNDPKRNIELANLLVGEEKTCGPKVVYIPRDLRTPKRNCVIERYLHDHNIDVTPFLEYRAYQQFLAEGPRYDSELDRLLGITKKQDIWSCFSDAQVTWVRTYR